jgi:hypothetical protein
MSGPATGVNPGGAADNHEYWDQLVVGYALHALEPQEEISVENHVAGCDRCARATVQMQETTTKLAYAVEPMTPPPALRDAVLASFPVEAGSPAQIPVPAGEPIWSPGERAGAPTSLAAARLRRGLRALPHGWALAAAGIVLIIAVGVSVGTMVRNRDANRRLDRTTAALSCVQSDGCRAVPLTTGALDPADRGSALMRGDAVTLVVRGLPNTGQDSVYVLWQKQRSGEVLAVGAFDVHQAVTVSTTMHLRDPGSVVLLAVTREPGHTPPPSPGSAPVAVATVA